MVLDNLVEIDWWAYPLGFAYALIAGQWQISKVVKKMYELVERGFEKKRFQYKWQPPIVGRIDSILYIISLLASRPEFIGLWVLLKVSVPYLRWKGREDADDDEIMKGRCLFMNSLYGNGLTILYAILGYLIIIWLNKGNWWSAFWVAIILIVFTQILSDYLEMNLIQ